MTASVSVVIPTFNGGASFERLLGALATQDFPADVELIVIDSGSTDRTVEAARRHGARVISIGQAEFHHARTRNHAVALARHELVLCTVQDALPGDERWLATCVSALDAPEVSAAFGRQRPHADADLFACFVTESHARHLGDAPIRYSAGRASRPCTSNEPFESRLWPFRADNVCGIYRRSALLAIPFPDISYAEDMAWSQRAQRAGLALVFDPRIQVFHSHNRDAHYHRRRAFVDLLACCTLVEPPPLPWNQQRFDAIAEAKQAVAAATPLAMEASARRRYQRVPRLPRVTRLFRLFSRSRPRLEEEAVRRFIEVAGVMGRIYPDAKETHRAECVQKLGAAVLGRLAGELFLSHKASGKVSPKFEQYIREEMSGV